MHDRTTLICTSLSDGLRPSLSSVGLEHFFLLLYAGELIAVKKQIASALDRCLVRGTAGEGSIQSPEMYMIDVRRGRGSIPPSACGGCFELQIDVCLFYVTFTRSQQQLSVHTTVDAMAICTEIFFSRR